SWWSQIDTANYEPEGYEADISLYDRLFQDKVAFDEATLELFSLNSSRTNLADTTRNLEDHLPALSAGLNARFNDILAITKGIINDLNLDTVSLLFRHVSLAKAVKLPVNDFITLKELGGINPFTSPATTLRFIEIQSKIREAGFDVSMLLLLLWHGESSGRPVFPAATIPTTLEGLRAGLEGIRRETELPAEIASTGDETAKLVNPALEQMTENKLGQLLSGAALDQALGLIRGKPIDDLEAFVIEHLPFLEPAEVVSRLVGEEGEPPELDPETALSARYLFVLEPLLDHLRRVLSETHIIQTLASAFSLPVRSSQVLLKEILHFPQANSISLAQVFLDDEFVGSSVHITAEGFSDQFDAFIRLWKAAKIVATLGISPDELLWLEAHRSDLEF
ncbi:MAG: hypothetical protein L0312_31570, partial [Acidobacteria bacterium]|nr:hypothetical protein [Acidobacteriota bacterium]